MDVQFYAPPGNHHVTFNLNQAQTVDFIINRHAAHLLGGRTVTGCSINPDRPSGKRAPEAKWFYLWIYEEGVTLFDQAYLGLKEAKYSGAAELRKILLSMIGCLKW